MKKIFKKAAVSFMAGVVLMGSITLGSQNNTVQAQNTKKVRTAAIKEYNKELVSNKTVDEFCVVDVTGDKIPELITHGNNYDNNGTVYMYNKKRIDSVIVLEGFATFYPNKHTCMMSVFDDDENWYKLNNGEYELVATYNEGYYQVNGQKCSKTKYKQFTKKLKGKALKWSFVDNTKNNRKNIK